MKSIVITLFSVFLAACAGAPEKSVIIDRKGVDLARYDRDLAECSTYAAEVEMAEDTARDTARGAVVGGAVGAIIDGGEGAARGAGIGGVTGGARGYVHAEHERERVVKNCLRGRGYRVLN